MRIRGIIFDKDGTLFRFGETWNAWCEQCITQLASGDMSLREAIAEAIDYDLDTCSFRPQSIAVSGTTKEIAIKIAPFLPAMDTTELETFLNEESATTPLVQITPLKKFVHRLIQNGINIGVVTNDSQVNAVRQLKQVNILNELNFIAGYDSGFGAKPSCEPLLAFARHVMLAPENIAMVGDTLHDMIAGRCAGMKTIAVLTGLSRREELDRHADVVLQDISEIPAFLGLS